MKTHLAAALRLALSASFAGSFAGCSVGTALCQKEEECADDNKGDEFVQICTIQYDGAIQALRTNKEGECQSLADAQLAFDACRAALDCDDFTEADLGQKCDDEKRDLDNAVDDARNDCTSLD